MARKTGHHVLHKTPEKTVGLATGSTKEKEKQNNGGNPGGAGRTGSNVTIFDDVFKTIQEKLPELAIPLINEAFGTAYPPDAKVVRCGDEYHTRRGRRQVDLHLRIGKKRYHLECQTMRDGKMVIRMWEYDAAIALEHAQKKKGRYRVRFPQSCVLQLRGEHKYERMKMDIILPDGQKFKYSVPVLWLSDYTSDKIFQKQLLFLLPFYIIRYEGQSHRLETDRAYLDGMLAEYREIETYLERELLEKNRETAYRDMIELINRLADYVMRDSEKVKQEVESVMGGKVLKLQTDYLIVRGTKVATKRAALLGGSLRMR